MKKKILAISYLFPNSEQPHHGIFVLNRLVAMSEYADITVINPIPHSPVHSQIEKLQHYKNVAYTEEMMGLTIYHPRFFSIPGYLKSIESVTYYLAVLKVIKEIGNDFDLIDLHWTYPDLPTGSWLSKKWDIPFNVTLRGMEAFHLQDSGLRKVLVKHFLGKANHVISLSQEMADKANELAQTGSRTSVIRNGVDTDKFYHIDQNQCRKELGIKIEDKVILGVGAIIYRKGFDLVIRTLPKILATPGLENTKFYIVGSQGAEGDYRSELKKLITELNLDTHVVFAGKAKNEQLVQWYNAADVFCLSSRGEGSPNVLTEALACGTISVATNVGSVVDIMESESGSGYVVESNNIEMIMSETIKALSDAPNNKVSRAESFSKYTWDWCANKVLAIGFK